MASESTRVSGLAGRYAKALFELAEDQKQLDRVASDLTQLKHMIAGSPDLVRLIRSPMIGREQQAAAMARIAETADLGPLTRNFVALVSRNRRLFVLDGMIDGYLALLAQARGEMRAEVTAARELSREQVDAVTEQLRRAVGSKVAVDIQVDPAILGGLVVKVGSRMVDSSLRSKLQRLQAAMRGN